MEEKGTAKMLAGNGERRGALRARSSSIVCTYVCVCMVPSYTSRVSN